MRKLLAAMLCIGLLGAMGSTIGCTPAKTEAEKKAEADAAKKKADEEAAKKKA